MSASGKSCANIVAWVPGNHDIPAALGPMGCQVAADIEQLRQTLPRVEGIILSAAHLSAPLVQEIRRNAPRLRWLHLVNAGYDTVRPGDFSPATIITYSPGAGATTVAEHVLALMLALCRCIPLARDLQARQNWDYGLAVQMSSLRGSTVALLGSGQIARALARLLEPFDVRLIAASRSGRPWEQAAISCTLDRLENFLPEADFVVVAAPLTGETKHYFNRDRFAAMKAGSCFLNISRGGIVDLDALDAALTEGRLAGAALDVTDPEPLPPDHPIWRHSRLLVTPHAAAAGQNWQDRRHLVAMAVENARRFAAGEPLLHVVGPEQSPLSPAGTG